MIMNKTNCITSDTIVVRNDKKFITSPIGDEIVMMSMESGNYIGINEVGAVIWNKLEKPATIKEVIEYLLSIYDITEEACTEKTIKHIADMAEQEMVLILK